MATYDELMNRKTSLEFEINTYRRLLECEETRIKTGVSASSSSYSYQSRQSSHAAAGHHQHQNGQNSGGVIGSLISGQQQPQTVGVNQTVTTTVTQQSTSSSSSGGTGQVINAAAGPQAVDGQPRQAYVQRGSSTELSSETITKRMQVQRTSKGNIQDDN